MSTGKLVVGITGASGAIYAKRFLIHASKHWSEIYLTMSDQALQVAATELGVAPKRQDFCTEPWLGVDLPQIRLLNERDYFTPPASGSFRHDGMVIVPCSMGSIGRIQSSPVSCSNSKSNRRSRSSGWWTNHETIQRDSCDRWGDGIDRSQLGEGAPISRI